VVRRILTGSLALGPIVILLHYFTDIGDVEQFVLASIALVPLAWIIGEATEHAAHHTGPGIGGFLNATFGNAPELIIALIAVNEGLTEVVRGSLTGSVVGNLLLVLGFSLALGGRGPIDKVSTFSSLGLVGLAVVAFLIPAIPGWEGDPDRHSLAVISLPVAIGLLTVYLVVTWRSLRRHRDLHVSGDPSEAGWSLRASLAVLGAATVVTAFVAEVLVGALDTFAEAAGLSEFFVAAVIVAIVGNAAEHGGAVVIARRGNIKLAAEIALASSAQVAVFLIPAVAIISWAIEPLSLAFRPVELGVLAAATALTAILLRDGRSTRTKGIILIVAYGFAALSFYLAGDRNF
jgi:Ca2+:H+ antiporter